MLRRHPGSCTRDLPATHDIKRLRSLAEDQHGDLIDAWPRDSRMDRRHFDLLRRAYIEARYSEHYKITKEELDWLGERVGVLAENVEQVCNARIGELGG